MSNANFFFCCEQNSVLGSILVVVGMYILLWGKINEAALLRNAIKPVVDPATTTAEEI